MILVGVELVQRFRVVTLLFAGVLLASAAKLLTEGEHDDEEMSNNSLVRLSKAVTKSVEYYDGDKFFTKLRDGSRAATPLLLCVVCIELSDFVFAVDSIPAVLAITKDPFIVYSSNIFAIAALRSLYQVLSAAIAGLPYLRPAVALILGFVGLKMLAEYYHIHVPTSWSLGVIVATLGGGIALSLWPPPASPQALGHPHRHAVAASVPTIVRVLLHRTPSSRRVARVVIGCIAPVVTVANSPRGRSPRRLGPPRGPAFRASSAALLFLRAFRTA